MNFLQLVQDLARQSGTLAGGTALSSVVAQTGRADKLVNWISSAWVDIQNEKQGKWNWLRGEFQAPLTIGQSRYTATDLGLTRFSAWEVETRRFEPFTTYDPSIGQRDESEIGQIDYSLWRSKYDRRTHDANRPIEWALSPANELCVGTKPDKAYVLRGEYWKSPQELSANDDAPEVAVRHHKAIVYKAMMLMAESDESIATFNMAERKYGELYANLCNDRTCLPHVSVRAAGPLA
jgi:hypothetical protein